MPAKALIREMQRGRLNVSQVSREYRILIDGGVTNPTVEITAPGASFDGLDLPCAVLKGDLARATFFHCDLRGADLSGITRIRLVECQLVGAVLPEEAEIIDC